MSTNVNQQLKFCPRETDHEALMGQEVEVRGGRAEGRWTVVGYEHPPTRIVSMTTGEEWPSVRFRLRNGKRERWSDIYADREWVKADA